MTYNTIDISGQRFGNLVVIKQNGRKDRQILWECQCDCGNKTIVRSRSLRDGTSTSCKCRMSFRKSINERFWEKVEKTETCWNWKGCSKSRGYGTIFFKGKPIYCHRYSYKYHFGEFDKNLFVCHKCDNPLCVNPEHLFLGTNKDNMDDMINKNRKKVLKGSELCISKLNEEKVLYCRYLYSVGFSIASMADFFKVTFATMNNAIYKRSWKHI